MPSPYEVVLGTAFDGLHPRLRAYFGEIPPGSVGRGQGSFDTVEETASGELLLVDHLGTNRRLGIPLHVLVRNGALELRSSRTTATTVRVGRRRIRIPALIAPTVTFTERFDDAEDRQQVSVVIALPGLGRIYEYAGSFEYAITAETIGRTPG